MKMYVQLMTLCMVLSLASCGQGANQSGGATGMDQTMYDKLATIVNESDGDLEELVAQIENELGSPAYDSIVLDAAPIESLDLGSSDRRSSAPDLREADRVLYWVSGNSPRCVNVVGIVVRDGDADVFSAAVYPPD